MALGKSSLLKMAAQAFKAGNCFNIFLNFGGFWGTISYEDFSY